MRLKEQLRRLDEPALRCQSEQARNGNRQWTCSDTSRFRTLNAATGLQARRSFVVGRFDRQKIRGAPGGRSLWGIDPLNFAPRVFGIRAEVGVGFHTT